MPADVLTPELICRDLATKRVGRVAHCFEEVDSTNLLARQYAERGAPDGTVITAEHQRAGRGRLGRSWTAPPRSSLLCSVVFYPALAPECLFRLTMLASIAVADVVCGMAGIQAGIKWPNDIYACGKKVCGILTEVDCAADRVRYAVVGIGLNVNWLPAGTELHDRATSLKECSGVEFSRLSLLRGLLQRLDALYGAMAEADLQQLWQDRCVHIGKEIQLLSGAEVLRGTTAGITHDGHLVLATPEGTREILCGDVSLRW
jgi:BirA family biotin operon repressor/biotin-[acetyl-CoA-carboxylase] ligase